MNDLTSAVSGDFGPDDTGCPRKVERTSSASDAQYRAIFELPALGIGQVDCHTGRLLLANPKYCEILGYPLEELRCHDFLDLTHPEDRAANVEMHGKLLRGEVPDYTLEKRYLRKDGQVIWVRVTATLLYDGQGRPAHVLGVVQEIGERKRAEQALCDSEARWRALVETTRDLVWEVDENGLYTYVSPQVREILGYEPHELLGRRPIEFVVPEQAGELLGQFDAISAAREPFSGLENINLRKDGSRVVLETNGSPFFDETGNFKGFRGIDRDITERKAAERALAESEQRYRALMEHASDAILVVSSEGRFIDANRRAVELLGYTRDELLQIGPPHIHPPEEQGRLEAAFLEMRENRTSLYEIEVCTKEGRRVAVEVAGTRIAIGDNHVYLGSFRDVTERRRQQAALQEMNEELQAIFCNFHVLIGVMDRDFNFLRVNTAYARASGQPVDFFVGKNHFALFPHEENERIFRRVVATGETYSVAAKPFEHPDQPERGTTYWDWTLAPMREGDGPVTGVVVSLVDVTEAERGRREARQVLERRVAERTAELAVAIEELEAFSYSVSHDLRAPLRRIDGFAHLLRKNTNNRLDDAGEKHLARILSAAGQMNTLIDDLLYLSRLARSEPRRERVDLGVLAREVVEQLADADPSRAVEIRIAEGIHANADAGLMRAVLENLLGNAWKFTAGRTPAVIEFSCMETQGESVYFVRDNGAGFDMRYVDKLFGPFQRLHSNAQFPGTGIGLATVRRVIHRHGGRVWAEGALDRGATFYFTLGGTTA